VQQRAKEIREAQLIRGNPMKRIVDWLPLILPLLITSLEKAFLLSESMTARGFYSQHQDVPYHLVTGALIIAVFLIFSGWILGIYDYPWVISAGLYSLSCLILLLTLVYASRRVKITRYHQEKWCERDSFSTVLLLTALVIWILLQAGEMLPTTAYTPYPFLSLPPVQIAGIVLSLTPLVPLPFFEK